MFLIRVCELAETEDFIHTSYILKGKTPCIEMPLTIPRQVRRTSGRMKGSGGSRISRPWVDKDPAKL